MDYCKKDRVATGCGWVRWGGKSWNTEKGHRDNAYCGLGSKRKVEAQFKFSKNQERERV